MSFVHLHTHSDNSLLDGAAPVNELFARAAELRMPAIAVTDHGSMYGVMDIWEASKEHGVKPIFGLEAYLAPDSRFEKTKLEGAEPYYHLTLLAETDKGLKNLYKLVTTSWEEGFYYKPRIDKDLLGEHSEGLIALSGCLAGELCTDLLSGGFGDKIVAEYRDIFGQDNYFIELQDHGLYEQHAVLPRLEELAKQFRLKTVATGDIHYVQKSNAKMHDLLLCIQTGATLDQEKRFRFGSEEFYAKSAEEMRELFSKESCDTTLEIAERCNAAPHTDELHLPIPEVPDGHTALTWLRDQTFVGARNRYGDPLPDPVVQQIEFELEVVARTNFPGYFLVVKDLVDYAHKEGIRVGPGGRGSATGSIISYCLGITGLDPLKYELDFSRFLVETRKSPPDIDLDVDDRYRNKILDYAREKHGADHVAQICTFGTVRGKTAIKDTARAMGYPAELSNKVTKLYPPALLGREWPLEEALKKSQPLADLYNSDEDVRRIYDTARELEGIKRHHSIHAAGVVIGDAPLVEYMPLQRKWSKAGVPGPVVTQVDMDGVEKLGLLKIDTLGLRNLSVLDICLKLLRDRGVDVDVDNLPEGDEDTFAMLQAGNTVAVFQLEASGGMRKLVRMMRPSQVEDLMAIVALYRPGPMGENLHVHYARRKHGQEAVEYLHKDVKPFLESTYGLICYQEQVGQIAMALAGYTPEESDDFRKAIGKKKPEVMAAQKEKFISGMVTNGYDQVLGVKLFDTIEYFAGYSFNKAHSAAYGYLAYLTAYLKCHYPVEYMAAALSSVRGNKERTGTYLSECNRLGIKVLPPSINKSGVDFACDGNNIRFALGSIALVGETIHKILEERSKGPFRNYVDFATRLAGDLDQKVLASLIKSGALDELFVDSKLTERLMYGKVAPRQAVRAAEKEVLGLFIIDHPMNGVKTLEHTIGSLDALPHRSDVEVLITPSDIQEKKTRAGTLMGTGYVEDLTGFIEAVFFPKAWAQAKGSEIVRCECVVEHREEGSVLLVHKAEPYLTDEPVVIRLSKFDFYETTFEEIGQLIDQNPGSLPVYIEIVSDEETIRMKIPKTASHNLPLAWAKR